MYMPNDDIYLSKLFILHALLFVLHFNSLYITELIKLQSYPKLTNLNVCLTSELLVYQVSSAVLFLATPAMTSHYGLLIDCPICDAEDYRIEVLVRLRKLERLDKDQYTDDERGDAEDVIIFSCFELINFNSLFACIMQIHSQRQAEAKKAAEAEEES